ncbi:solute carrier family 2, facilitated glucose transporter member 8-like [Mytilus trossulus]|uniref:solute carrier family 2, facilitated glucose transporter member 8-like n=1 Tax=Mytilus trossulus TaxID=6551 RepID=UPI0030051750
MDIDSLDSSSARSSPKLSSTKYEGSPFRLYVTVAFVCLGPFAFGYTIGYSSPALPQMQTSRILTKEYAAWFGSLLPLAAMFGGPLGGWMIEKYGRKSTLLFTSAPYIIGWWLIARGGNVTMLLLGRLLTGLASGLITVCAPVYIAEVSTKSLRGLLGACNQLSITVGILMVYSLGLHFKWDTLALFGSIPAGLTAIAMFFVPETPRYLLMKERRIQALQSLVKLRGPHTDVEDECRDIEEGIDTKDTFTYSEFKKPELSRPLYISLAIMFFQQFSGINAIMFYTVAIFKSAGIQNSEFSTVIIGAVQVVSTVVACFLMDKAGRRRLLIIAGSIMTVTCFTFGAYYFAIKAGRSPETLSWLAVGSLIIYIIGFSLGWGPIPLLAMSELFPARARGAASGIAIFVNWLCAFIVTKQFSLVQDWFGEAVTFWIFGAFCLGGVMFVIKYLPETKGKSLEDIELYFLGRSITYSSV